MKSILYAGATLMIGASIYGFVDYKKTQHKKEFTGMYESGTKKEPAIVAVSKTTEPAVKKDAVITEKKAVTKKQTIRKEEAIPSIQPINEEDVISTKERKVIDNPEISINVPEDNNIEKKVVKKKRKLSTKLFSRAPIREEEPELTEPAKTVVKKTKNKEQ